MSADGRLAKHRRGEDHVSLAARDVSAKAPNCGNGSSHDHQDPSSQANALARFLTSPQVRIVRPCVRWPNPMSGHLTGFPKEMRGFFIWPWPIWPSEGLKGRWHFSLFGRPEKPEAKRGKSTRKLEAPVRTCA